MDIGYLASLVIAISVFVFLVLRKKRQEVRKSIFAIFSIGILSSFLLNHSANKSEIQNLDILSQKNLSELLEERLNVRENEKNIEQEATPEESQSDRQEQTQKRQSQSTETQNSPSVKRPSRFPRVEREKTIQNFSNAQRSKPNSRNSSGTIHNDRTRYNSFPKIIIFRRKLCRGMKGRDVLNLQKLLQAQGYLSIAPDGEFGRQTEAAIAQFQQDRSLVDDGVFGITTCEAIAEQTKDPIVQCHFRTHYNH